MRRRTWLIVAAPLVVAATGALLVWTLRPASTAGRCALVSGPAALPEILEASGLAVSRRTPGLLWTHNDSGNAAILFAIDATGAVHGRVRVPVSTVDWEDVSAARCATGDCLYVADIGDNRARRRHIRIYRVPEPLPGDAETAAPEVFDATYADGPHNAEAMFVVGTDLYIVTRDSVGGLYRAALSGGRILMFHRIGELSLGAVSDAETSRDERLVAVRTSHEAVLYRTSALAAGQIAPYARVPIDGLREAQGEGIALDGNRLYLSSEAGHWRSSGAILALDCDPGIIGGPR